VIESSPQPGQAIAPGGEISLAFDQPMNPDLTAKALVVTDSKQAPVAGAIAWKNPRLLVFHPKSALQPGAAYLARLDTTAASAQGKALAAPLALAFQASGDLKVSQVFPANAASGVDNKAAITVMFDHPVVPLVIAEDQANLVNPLTIQPPLKGHGQWINTSLYVYRPDGVLAGGQTYQVSVKAGLLDATADPATSLKQDYAWSFSVITPAVSYVSVNDQDVRSTLKNIPLNPAITILFQQPMDRPSVEAGLRLTGPAGRVPLKFTWDADQGVQATIHPAQNLALGSSYKLSLDPSVRSADGSPLAAWLPWEFTTVPYPAIDGTTPVNGAASVDPEVRIYFASPMDFKTLLDKVVFTPALDTKTHAWYDPYASVLYFYGLQYSTRYTVQILPGMRDPYGNAIQSGQSFSFTTTRQSPFATLLMPNQPLYRAGGPQDFYLNYVNLTSVSTQLYRLSTDTFARLMHDNDYRARYAGNEPDLVWQYAETPDPTVDKRVLKDLTMTSAGKPLGVGLYFLGLKATPVPYATQQFVDTRLFSVNTDNITVKVSPGQFLAWLTDLQTGKPSAGVKVQIFDQNFLPVTSGVTDANGLFQAAVDTTNNNADVPNKSDYQSQWFALADDGAHFAFGSSNWDTRIDSGSLGLYDQYYRPWTDATAYVYTERPLYRPGQPVYFKGIVRADDDLAYSVPAQKQVQVTINSYKQQVYQETLTLGEIGTFDGTFQLASDADLGSYTLAVAWPGSKDTLNSITFDVAQYRRPEFQIALQAAPANLLPGDSFNVGLDASYYSGGGLSQAGIDWNLSAQPFSFTPPSDYSAYSFSNDEYDNWSYYATHRSSPNGQQLASGKAQTDADGKAAIPLKASPSDTTFSQRLVFEATVTDFSGASVSGQAQVIMHKSAVYPGVRSKSYVATVGDDTTFQLVALDWDGKPLPGAKVDVEIVERNWYSVQQENDAGQLVWQSTVEETPAAAFGGVQLDGKGLGTVSFKPAKGGVYRVKVTAVDSHGNQAQSSTFIWVAGPEYVPWIQSNDRTFQLVADKTAYAPGDTAEILIASPFQGESHALITLERGHVRHTEVLQLQGNSTVYRLPITPDMAPDVYVSVVVVKGIDATNPRPNFKLGLAKLVVDTGQQAIKLSLQADQPQAAPRQVVHYAVQTTTLDGKPIQAEVSLALSDLAALSLKDSTVPTLMDFFYAQRSLSVVTGVAINQSIEDYNANIASHLPADGRGAGSGGGKGGGYTGVIEVRQDFPDTAYWQAHLQTGADGKATFTVTLPDNLTTWRLDARAVTADTRVGQATLDLISTRPLLVRPQTPRFFVVGDKVSLGTAVHNNTAQDLSVTVKLDATGLTLQSPPEQTISIPAKRQAYVTWDATVPAGSTRADLVFSATGGGLSDASRPTLGSLDNQGIPVYRYESPETVGTSGMLTDNGGHTEAISLPPSMQVQQGQLKVELAPSLAAGLTDGLTYLAEYPYESIEGTISRFLPNLRLGQALQAAGVQDTALIATLKSQVNQALQKLYKAQNADGGWGWWGSDQSDLLTTAYAALGLSEAKTAGYDVTPAPLNNALSFLSRSLETFSDQAAPEKLNRQAFVLYVLARAGAPDVSQSVKLYDLRRLLGVYARGYLLQTLYKINPQDARLATLISDLSSAAILSAAGAHWEEKAADYWNWNTDLRSTAIVLAALIETDPHNALNANAVRWLMVNRKDGRWNTPQETAWTLLALTDWVTSTDDLKPDYRFGVAFNGTELASGTASPQTVRQVTQLTVDVTKLLTEETNRLVVGRDGSAGSLYYTAYLNLWLPVNQIKALDRGIVVTRQYFRPGDLTHPVTDAKQGEVLLARLTVVAPNDLRYLVVDDPLPAGMEAVDTSLNTSPKAQQPDSYDWKRIDTDGWGWWYFSHIELQDSKVVLSTDYLPAGTYVYTYLVRASTPGTFNVMPSTAQQVYFPDVYGRGDGSAFTIEP
jgi:uncharacterized protein YfaS (alpha-2-macroglobulin family)